MSDFSVAATCPVCRRRYAPDDGGCCDLREVLPGICRDCGDADLCSHNLEECPYEEEAL